ncbi:hypothetical protein OG302_20175 [Streptomyces sp. NBC_01283]|uniref:hypothetical protein n=1 Tax=Streptomyces sp. NBC_01283 TaxID=2903812 RepID=UPI00352EA5C7|nr:hypothetical protein OG302_20175 [Streptomyces sp. NBC_01283]
MRTEGKEQTSGWPSGDDARWAAEFELALAVEHSPPEGLAEEALEEARMTAVEAGAPVREVLGDPTAYAETVAAERIDETRRSSVDVEGFAPGDRFTSSLLLAGGQVALFGVVLWAANGLWMRVGWATGGAGLLLAVLIVLVTGVVPELRAAGRLRAGRVAMACAVVLVVVCAALFTAVPRGPQVSVPAPSLFAVGALLGAVGWRITPESVGRWFRGRTVPAEDIRSGREGDAGSDDEAWLTRLFALLRGRHGVPAADARRSVAEARDHLAASGGSAAGEFGDVEVYALRLSEGPGKSRRAARAEVVPTVLFTGGLLWWGIDLVSDPEPASLWFWAKVAVLVAGAWAWTTTTWSLWHQLRPAGKR